MRWFNRPCASRNSPVASGIQSLDQAVETGDVPEETAEQVMDRVNREIESHCRALKKLFAACPDDPWMDHADYKKSALADLDLCCKQLRLAKCKHICLSSSATINLLL